ncbi:MAG: alpha/beta hydrolase fold domain-containing protein, partial [Terriglobales bacterium]
VLNKDVITTAWARYCPDFRRFTADVSPLASDDFRALPPAIVIIADRDPLRDEGEKFAAALAGHGVEVSLRRYPGTVHGFFQIPASSHGRLVIKDIAGSLATRFSTPSPAPPQSSDSDHTYHPLRMLTSTPAGL